MRKIIGLAAAAVLILYGLIACGIVPHAEASAPMAQDPSQVRATLTALPEDLHSVTLLARTASLVLRASNEGSVSTYEYRPSSGAYRRLTVPLDGEWKIGAMAASPDGCLWTVFHGEKDSVLMKTSQGNVLIQRELEDFSPETILCDSVGHVFAATTEEVRRYSPEGELQETVVIPEQSVKELRLASRQDRLFLRMRCAGKRAVYWELQADMSLGDSFEACVSDSDVWPIGSFLADYSVMEADSVGLYAYREDGGWETVCLWSDCHLDGTVGKHLISDAQGYGVVQYEKNGESYCLNLMPA